MKKKMKTTKRLAMSLLLVLAIPFLMACSACVDTGLSYSRTYEFRKRE